MIHLGGLNEKQKEAATHMRGPLLVVAGAGAGKTKTIAHRIVNLIKNGVAPKNILAVTFTNKAAKEMSERVSVLVKKCVPESISLPWVSTFHALGVAILRNHADLADISRYFSIIDKEESLSLIKKSMREINLDPKNFNPRVIQSVISKQKNNLKQPSDYEVESDDRDYFKNTVLDTWKRYEKKIAEQSAFDFDDLILKTVFLFKKHPEVLNYYQELWRFIHIDEYQDTNTAQYELSKLLAEKYQNICVVGDLDQSIYGWRNADFRNILNFEKNFSGTTTVLMEENYRSTQNILKAANQVISKNILRKDKNLFTKNKSGEKISLFSAANQTEEAVFVVKKIKELAASGEKLNETAVLYRTNFQSRSIEEACINFDLPYHLLGTKFYERKEIKDAIAFIKLALNPNDFISLERIINVPARGIGEVSLLKILSGQENLLPEKTKEKLTDFRIVLGRIKKHLLEKGLAESIKFIIKITGIENDIRDKNEDNIERIENLRELANLSARYDIYAPNEAIEKFLTDTSLASDQDSLSSQKNGVRLMTVHASKGLEFKHVFVVGMEQDLFPHRELGPNENRDKEEERRLFYVALTRAKEKIWLSYCQQRSKFGFTEICQPSEFLGDISDNLIEFQESKKENLWAESQKLRTVDKNRRKIENDDIVWECLGGS